MGALLKECEEQAMRLSAEDRAVLAQHLIASLDCSNENERMWVEEAAVRYEAYKRGEIKAYSAEEVVRELRDSFE